METYDESVDADSIHSSERDSWDDELDDDGSYSVSSADKSSTDGNNDADEVGGDIKVRFDTITAEEIRCMEFATVSEAYDFYYRYGKYNGFAVRKSDSRVTGSGDNKVIKMKQFVCNKHGVREKRHLVRTDRKLEHRRLTRTQCGARLRVNYKAEKDRYVVTAFEETHNHELTPARNNELVADFKSSSTDPVLSTQLPVIESHADNLVLSRWTKDAKIQYLNISNCNDNVDSNTIAEARFGSYCTVLTDFCREASKKDGVYAQIMEDLMQLKIKYCNNDDAAVGTQKSAVGDPVMGTQQTSEQAPEPNVDMYSVSISDSVSQIAEKKKRKASCNGQKSVQNKSLYDPTTYRGANVMTTTQVEVPTTSIGIHQQMFPMQSMMPMVHPMMQQMHMQPMYPMYGMQPGMQSGMQTGLLQQVIRSSKNN
ncbi:unnamed protein product [Trifolium pratense]|uniref:Uncharacterized protein n=1 Tax=Trifolium pratense TaxID=57577 RepID=A0ACB0JCJ0_TRIPR|nr:unnamed protein product [Trifolium pratense]